MSDGRALIQGPVPGRASGVSSDETDIQLSPYPEVQRDLGEAYKKYAGYAEIIARGGPLAPQFYDSIFYSEVERTVARIFGEQGPHMVEGSTQRAIEWTDVLREMLTPGDFQRQPNGMYRCCVRGSLIEVTEANYIEILTGVTERLLQPLQNLSDEQKETRVRLKLSSYLHQTHQSLVQFANAVRTSIHGLNRPPPIHVANPVSARHEGQLSTPRSARPRTSAREVIHISDSGSDNNDTNGNPRPEASASARRGPPAIFKIEPNIKEEPVNSHPSRVNASIDPVTDATEYVLPPDFLQRAPLDSASDSDDYIPPTDTQGSESTDSVSETGYAVSSTDESQAYSTDYLNNVGSGVVSSDVSQCDSAGRASDLINDTQPFNYHQGNAIASARDTNDDAGLIAFNLLRAASARMNNRNVDTGLVDRNITLAINNHVLGNTNTNTGANVNAYSNTNHISNANANTEWSGLISEAVSQVVRPWLRNTHNPDDADNDSHSSGSDIPWNIKAEDAPHSTGRSEIPLNIKTEDASQSAGRSDVPLNIKTEDAAHSTGTAVVNEHGAKSHGSKRPRADSYVSEQGSKLAPAKRYSQLEEEEGPAFVRELVHKGSTTSQVEEEYAQMFGVHRTAAAIFKKFKTKGTWALLKPLREAKKQKTMVPSPFHYFALTEDTLLTTARSQPSLAALDTHAHPMGLEPD
ncbi:uncharacterized protein N7500_006732 [Penicillium coprophilum]|uniref:uncharacterized protein n=1 Tax=Penicillium coprophilum TaxID=36646 RepID=UPI0023866EDB|nr:uncharacterized protein N7500_006732 [Penicillium coprophilum]KAJ5164902.1 hypothetical protein N7500_006732 [Penicillium coprophilum]